MKENLNRIYLTKDEFIRINNFKNDIDPWVITTTRGQEVWNEFIEFFNKLPIGFADVTLKEIFQEGFNRGREIAIKEFYDGETKCKVIL